MAVGSLAVAVFARFWRKRDLPVAELAGRIGVNTFLYLTMAQILLGMWFLMSLPRDIMLLFMGKHFMGTIIFCATLLLALTVLITALRRLV